MLTSLLCRPAVKIKKPIKTKFRMPVFNWVALKPNQINGTVFNEIDDERILEVAPPTGLAERATCSAFRIKCCPFSRRFYRKILRISRFV